MSSLGKGMVPLSSQTTEAKRAYLDARVKRIHSTRSEALTAIFDFWLAMGAPPIFEHDNNPPPVPDAIRPLPQCYWGSSVWEAYRLLKEKPQGENPEAKSLAAWELLELTRGADGPTTPGNGKLTRTARPRRPAGKP